jgi:hypothetical protein
MSLANFLSEFKQLTTLYEDVTIVARPERTTLKSKGQELDLYLKPEGESSMYIGGTIDSLDLSPIITLANANGFFFDNTALARLLCTKGVTLTHETLSRNLAINKTPIRSELLELFDGIGRINNTYGHPSKIMSAVSKYQDLTLVLGTKALVVIKDGKISEKKYA